jgi:hypothetical protein
MIGVRGSLLRYNAGVRLRVVFWATLAALTACRYEGPVPPPAPAASAPAAPEEAPAAAPQKTSPAAAPPVGPTCERDDDCVVVHDCCSFHVYPRSAAPAPPECQRPLVCPGNAEALPTHLLCVKGGCIGIHAPPSPAPPESACSVDEDCVVVPRCCGPRIYGRRYRPPGEDCAETECPAVKWGNPSRVVCRNGWCLGA